MSSANNEATFVSLIEQGIVAAVEGDFDSSMERIESAVARWPQGGPWGFNVPGSIHAKDVFQVVHCWYRPKSKRSLLILDEIKSSALNGEWREGMSSTWPDQIFVPTLLLSRNGDYELWNEVRAFLPQALERVSEYGSVWIRYLAKVAFLGEDVGDAELAEDFFAEVNRRLVDDQSCPCRQPGCSMGVGEWLSDFGKLQLGDR